MMLCCVSGLINSKCSENERRNDVWKKRDEREIKRYVAVERVNKRNCESFQILFDYSSGSFQYNLHYFILQFFCYICYRFELP